MQLFLLIFCCLLIVIKVSRLQDYCMSISGESIDWSDVVKKEARGIDNADLGEVQEIGQNYVMTQRGVISRDKFFIPKYMVEGYDGHTLWFNVSDVQLEQFKRDTPPAYEEYSARYRTPEVRSDIETRIPLIAEKLDVNKRVLTSEATIVKEPVTETKTIEVPVTHEELRLRGGRPVNLLLLQRRQKAP